jgi:hypothetical protein
MTYVGTLVILCFATLGPHIEVREGNVITWVAWWADDVDWAARSTVRFGTSPVGEGQAFEKNSITAGFGLL